MTRAQKARAALLRDLDFLLDANDGSGIEAVICSFYENTAKWPKASMRAVLAAIVQHAPSSELVAFGDLAARYVGENKAWPLLREVAKVLVLDGDAVVDVVLKLRDSCDTGAKS